MLPEYVPLFNNPSISSIVPFEIIIVPSYISFDVAFKFINVSLPAPFLLKHHY